MPDVTTTPIDLIVIPERCYRCDALTFGVVGVVVQRPGGREVFREFEDVSAGLAEVLDPAVLRAAGVGAIKLRRSRQRGQYISNGCVRCDAILGSFPLRESYLDFLAEGGRPLDLRVRV
jgi:hypothetical protein